MNTTGYRRTTIACSMLGGLVLAAGGAWAGNGGNKFKSMDTNSDGLVSAQEYAAGAKAKFGRMDSNGDGNVTAAEMDASHRMKAGDKAMGGVDQGTGQAKSTSDKIGKLDSNGDGMISAAEHEAGSSTRFSELDTDKSGSLSQQELQAPPKGM